MDIDVVQHVVRTAFRSGRELEGLLALLKAHCSPGEYQTFAKAIAAAIASIHIEVVNRVIASYPALGRSSKLRKVVARLRLSGAKQHS
jgi:hypothetical protein